MALERQAAGQRDWQVKEARITLALQSRGYQFVRLEHTVGGWFVHFRQCPGSIMFRSINTVGRAATFGTLVSDLIDDLQYAQWLHADLGAATLHQEREAKRTLDTAWAIYGGQARVAHEFAWEGDVAKAAEYQQRVEGTLATVRELYDAWLAAVQATRAYHDARPTEYSQATAYLATLLRWAAL